MLKFEVWLYVQVKRNNSTGDVVYASSIVMATDPISALQCVMEEIRKEGTSPNTFSRIEIVQVTK